MTWQKNLIIENVYLILVPLFIPWFGYKEMHQLTALMVDVDMF